jgi:hypothetical protein
MYSFNIMCTAQHSIDAKRSTKLCVDESKRQFEINLYSMDHSQPLYLPSLAELKISDSKLIRQDSLTYFVSKARQSDELAFQGVKLLLSLLRNVTE